MAGAPGWTKVYEHSPSDIGDGTVALWEHENGMRVDVLKLDSGDPYYDERMGWVVYPTEYWVGARDTERGGSGGGPELRHGQGVHGSYRNARAAAVELQRTISREGLRGEDFVV